MTADLAAKHLKAAAMKHLERAQEAIRFLERSNPTLEDWAEVKDKLWELRREVVRLEGSDNDE